MKKFLSIILILVSVQGYADELALSKDEILSRLDQNLLSLNKAFVLPQSDVSRKDGKKIAIPKDLLIAQLLKKNPTLKEEYLYYSYFRTNQWQYTIFYEWYNRKCVLRTEKFKKSPDGSITIEVTKLMMDGESIPIKYCEKVYGLKINK